MRVFLCATALASAAFGSGAAWAQQNDLEPAKNVAVRDRAKPEYAPIGVPMGAFRLYPEITLGLETNNNIYALEDDEDSDVIFSLAPFAALRSNWSTHELNFQAGAVTRQYLDYNDLSTTDYSVGVDGRYDVDRSFYFTGGADYFDGVESIASSPTIAPLEEPIPYSRAGANIAAVKAFNRYQLTLDAGFTEYDYDDADLLGGGTLSQDSRDRELLTYGARGDYLLSPDTSLFVEVTQNERDYSYTPAGQIERDSSGYEFLVGSDFGITNLARGEIAIGYFEQSYDSAAAGTQDGFDYRAGVDWFVDELVTVSFDASRDIGDAGVDGAVGYVASTLNARADYEFRRNWLWSAGAGYSNDDYDQLDREDDRYRVFISSEYLISRNAVFDASLSQTSQSSDGLNMGREYDITQFMVGLKLRR